MPIDLSPTITTNIIGWGSPVIFRDPLGEIADTPLSGIWSDRDIAEPTRGMFATLTVATVDLPVTNALRREHHYLIVEGTVEYRIIDAVPDDGGATVLKLKKVAQ